MRYIYYYAGWVVAVLAAIVLALLLPRLHLKILQKTESWDLLMARKQSEIASIKWEDQRPLTIMVGDSHIELGSWYELFDGANSIRNCGMSMATIKDVTCLVTSIPDHNPQRLVLMCGINNLTHQEDVDSCVRDYERLIKTVTDSHHPQQIVVMGVMPVRENLIGEETQKINVAVTRLNVALEKLCDREGCLYLNANKNLTDAKGGLDYSLTIDGLHLNRKGYKLLADEISKRIF